MTDKIKAQTFEMTAMNGETFEFRRLSPLALSDVWSMAAEDFDKRNPAPKPPKKLQELGPGKTVEVDDKKDPDYVEELADHTKRKNNAVGIAMINFACGVIVTELSAEQLAQGQAWVDRLKARGLGDDMTPTSAYVSRIAGITSEQMEQMVADLVGKPFRAESGGADGADTGNS